jgi:hypothetical protein
MDPDRKSAVKFKCGDLWFLGRDFCESAARGAAATERANKTFLVTIPSNREAERRFPSLRIAFASQPFDVVFTSVQFVN